MNDKDKGGYDWTDVLAAYEAYCKSLSESGAVYAGVEPVCLNEFLDCEYEEWREGDTAFAQYWPSDFGCARRDRAAQAAADMADLHVMNLPPMDEEAAEDLANAYASYVTRAFDAGMPSHGWSAPAIDEFYQGDYALWAMTRGMGGPNPYSELFGAMAAAAEAVEMSIAAATAPAMDEQVKEPAELGRDDVQGR